MNFIIKVDFIIKIVFKLLSKKFVVSAFALITIEQILVAGATALLGLSAQNLDSPETFMWLLTGFFVCSILPYGILFFLRIFELQGYFDAYFSFIKQRLLNLVGSPQKWQNHQQKESFLTALGPDAEGYLTAVAFSIFDIYLFFLGILLNVVSISIVVDKNFSYVFVISGVLSALVFFVFSKKVKQHVEEEQTTKIDFFSYILKSWDNVFLKNTSVNKLYTGILNNKYVQTRYNIGKAAYYSEGLVLILTILSFLPVFSLIAYLALTHRGEAAFLSGLIVTIPKQIMVLNGFRAFFGQITNLTAFNARFKFSWENSAIADSSFEQKIHLPHIEINKQSFSNLRDIEKMILNQKNGRLIVRGKNGAGKSTLLLHLNQILENSFYLPASPYLEIKMNLGGESTGERVLKHLEFIRNQTVSVLLLDEWDANLDANNKILIEQELNKMAEEILIVEVRHRKL